MTKGVVHYLLNFSQKVSHTKENYSARGLANTISILKAAGMRRGGAARRVLHSRACMYLFANSE